MHFQEKNILKNNLYNNVKHYLSRIISRVQHIRTITWILVEGACSKNWITVVIEKDYILKNVYLLYQFYLLYPYIFF